MNGNLWARTWRVVLIIVGLNLMIDTHGTRWSFIGAIVVAWGIDAVMTLANRCACPICSLGAKK